MHAFWPIPPTESKGPVENMRDKLRTFYETIRIAYDMNILQTNLVTSQKVLVHHVIPAKAGIQ